MFRPRFGLTRLTLTDFRCYAAARLECDARPVVLTGPNGAGKTNLLEAVSFLVPGRGLRRARIAEVARRDAPGSVSSPESSSAAADLPPRNWGVAARLETPGGTVEIGTGRDPAAEAGSERRAVRIDGAPVRSQTALADHASAVWLTPQMDRLFTEGAAGRRRFLDRIVYGFDPAHAGRVAAYEQAMRQRARLLREGRADAGWLDALESAMAARGVAVAAGRREIVRRLNIACADAVGPFPRAFAASVGTVEAWLDAMPALDAEERLREALARARPLDAASGTTTAGPHRGDLEVVDGARDVPAAQCSTGEQKALLIALVLATARLQSVERGAPPLLLLDEVAAHLDARRREALFDEICALGAQAWLSGTDAATFAPLAGRAQFFRVQDATVTPEGEPAGS